jgi:hypothetical protein
VADDEAALLVRHLGAVPPQRQHDRLHVLALAVDQRPVQIEQEGLGGAEGVGVGHFAVD